MKWSEPDQWSLQIIGNSAVELPHESNFCEYDIDNEKCICLQLASNSDDDYLKIYNINTTDRSSNLITRLSGPDLGPKSTSDISNWEYKSISSSSNNMVVEFRSDRGLQLMGFSATIHFTLLKNNNCETWMNMNIKIIQSPNYPNLYGNDIFCNHLITVQPNFHITLEFLEFDVSF